MTFGQCLRVLRYYLILSAIAVLYSGDYAIAQELRQMEVVDVPEGESVPYVVRNPDGAVLIVHSTIEYLSFETNNGGIQLGDANRGEYILHLNPGTHIMRFQAEGYVTVQKRLVIARKTYKEVRVVPRGNAPSRDYGTVEFRLTPGSVYYYLDGRPTGMISVPASGILSIKLEKGTHKIKLSRAGHNDIETEINIRAGEIIRSDQQFVAGQSSSSGTREFSTGIMVVKSRPQGAKIFIDGVESGVTDRQFKEIAIGSHEIRLEKLLYKEVVEQIEIGEDVLTVDKSLPPDFGELTIRADPAGADILLNGTTVGQSLYTNKQLRSGAHSITLRKRFYHDAEWQFSVEPMDILDTTITLQPAFGQLAISSQPDGARVIVDGADWGLTPVVKDTVPSRSYIVSVRMPLYGMYEATVQVEDGRTATVQAVLAEAFGVLSVQTVPSGLDVYSILSGESLGKTPLTTKLAPGFYRLRIEDPLFETVEYDASIEIGGTVAVDTTLARKTGTLRIFTEPFGADLFLDGDSIGQSPKILKNHPTGSYTIEARMDGYATARETAIVRHNQTDEIEIALKIAGSIRVSSTPTDVIIYIDGRLCSSNLIEGLPAGKYEIKVTAINGGYVPYIETVFVETGRTRDVKASLRSGSLLANSINYQVGKRPTSISSADFDGDGDIDLVVTVTGSHMVSILLNKGDGTFRTPVNYKTGITPNSVFAADFDGDSISDLSVAYLNSDHVSILLNNGSGIFQTAVDYSMGPFPSSVFLSDIDSDSDYDVIAANAYHDKVSIMLNEGNGTFRSRIDYEVGDNPYSIFVIDLDGDGDNDLMTANASSNNVSVLLNNGDGSYQAAASYGVGKSPRSILSIDLDGDGDNDLVTANSHSDDVSILLNNGPGTFRNVVSYSVGIYSSPQSVISFDLDGDGDNDLATANNGSDNVSVLLNNGDGTFQPAIHYGAGNRPYSIVSADFDGDGDDDLAVANFQSGDVSVLINNTRSPR